MVLIEDLHWIDPGSEAFLEEWVAATAGTRNLLLVKGAVPGATGNDVIVSPAVKG